MKKLSVKLTMLASMMLIFSFSKAADDQWPKQMTATDGSLIKVYQPAPESFVGNTLKFRAAISVVENGSTEPVFGTFWATAKVETDRDNRQIVISSLNTTNIKIPAITDQDKIDLIDNALESQFPETAGPMSLDNILSTLEQTQEETKLSQDISNKPPKVIFVTQPSMLVVIDGEPKLQRNPDWKLDQVINTPFTILKNGDGQYYLFGNGHWYISPEPTGPYRFTNDDVPQNLHNVEQQIQSKEQQNSNNNSNQAQNNNGQDNDQDATIPNIIVSTVPAELIQSKGEPDFTPIQGTTLLYVNNSLNDIFMDENSQQYFVLISGRWFQAKNLKANDWRYIAADQLPADFARIPPGSPKDNVLASVAGTDQARDAVTDAQVPQTAKVDRHTAATNVTYDGQPKFTDISGTDLQYAVNTSSTVLRTSNGRFYTVDNGVWFVSDNPNGPWAVSTDRPDEVDRIPPNNPAYNSKYVDVYDSDPDYVYEGYTPGYLNSYVYGPTVVYGTGYNYDPWYDGFYFPRPWSWGFNYGYSPFYGWSFGWGYDGGWFNNGFGFYGGLGFGCGWWGPSFYNPAYWGGWNGGARPYGFYGRSFGLHNNIRVNGSNNIYRNRGGVVTRTNFRTGGVARNLNNRPNSARTGGSFNSPRPNSAGARPGAGRTNSVNGASSPYGNVYSDRQGNVYQRGQQGQWQQRQNRSWAPVTNSRSQTIQNLNRQQVMRDRGAMRTQNFQRSMPSGGGSRSSGGGGARPSGGSSGGSRGGGGGGGSRGGGGGGRR